MERKKDTSCFEYSGALDVSKALAESEDVNEDSDEERVVIPTKRKSKRVKKKDIKLKKKKVEDVEEIEEVQVVKLHTTRKPKNKVVVDLEEEDDDLDELLRTDNHTPSKTTTATNSTEVELSKFLSTTQKVLESTKVNNKNNDDEKNDFKSFSSQTVKLVLSCNQSKITFTFSKGDSFNKILDSYCYSQSLSKDDLALKFDGITLKLDQSPQHYCMQDGDIINVYNRNQKINSDNTTSSTITHADNNNSNNNKDQPNLIALYVRSQREEKKKFRIKKNDKFEKLFYGYCNHAMIDINNVTFEFDGLKLEANSTPDDEDMEDGDIIDVKTKL